MTDKEKAVIKKVLLSKQIQMLIGADEWDLTDEEEAILWQIIKQFMEDNP